MARSPTKAIDADGKKTTTKDGSLKTLIIAGVVLTLISALGGWFLGAEIGKDVAPSANSQNSGAQASAAGEGGGAMLNYSTLSPILTNLAAPESTWIRMEISLIPKTGQALNQALVADISNDFIAFLHASTIAQLKGPSGLMNLRTDLLDRANIRSGGAVESVLISSMVIEQ